MDEEIFTLKEALELAQQRPGSRIFSFECKKSKDRVESRPSNDGPYSQQNRNIKVVHYDLVRKYHVVDIDYFCDYYESILKIRPHNLRYHEIIRCDKPCRLYLDLEFEKTYNSGLDGQKLTECFLDYIFGQMDECFQLIRPSYKDVLALDSSTGEKFSHHVIVHLSDGKLFRNNAILGRFMKFCVRRLENMSRHRLIALGLQNFFVKKAGDSITSKITVAKDPTSLWTDDEDEDDFDDQPKSQGRVSFCDLAVYGTNKSMRMFLSRKFGEKKKPFILAEDCRYYDPKRPDEILCRQILIDSLIEIVDPNESVLLDFVDPDNDSMASNNKAIKMSNYSFITRPFAKMQIECESETPELDKQVVKYLQDVLLFHDVEDERYPIIIRDRKITPDGRYLIFNLKNYNFCQNINRRHRNNQIKIVADLTRAVIYQKCYDPECWWFRSNFQPLDRNERLEGEIVRFSNKFSSQFNSGEKIWRGFEGKREDYDIEVILKPFSKLNV